MNWFKKDNNDGSDRYAKRGSDCTRLQLSDKTVTLTRDEVKAMESALRNAKNSKEAEKVVREWKRK